MTTHYLRTANYSKEARIRLGDAVAEARRAIGHRWRTTFAEEARISKRSVEAVERHEPTVGVTVLEEIGRALGRHLRDWDANTPKVILDGGPIPSHDPARRADLDIRWAARRDLLGQLRSRVEAKAFSTRIGYWQKRFAEKGYDEKEVLDVLAEARREAGENR